MRIVIYDNTDLSREIDFNEDDKTDFVVPSLSYAWWAGAKLFKGLGRFDRAIGVGSWDEFFVELIKQGKKTPIKEIQFWGHGWFGAFYIDGVSVTASDLKLDSRWEDLREVMATKPTWWFRTCATFGGERGKTFAEDWTNFFGGRAAGHTAIIGTWGVHSHGYVIKADEKAHWGDSDGQTANGPVSSKPWLPNTIPCLQSEIPDCWGATNEDEARTEHRSPDD